ncbi:capsular biosynthesis protein [Ciceribacter naphthalenivorans]|uniref:Capsular polysaccharide biosynthesis protein n=3 Tax=Pseudomonadota TaxID=1224 RepID=A0A512HJR8_9HYPH|nr:capsular biosynthesis protein [Ciceribacter naphthalenivorans]GEO85697.1 capsular polysaccharide biosynthesis protein [Ciceribacter naphthalenivorans]GLR21944.1 capsular polysaccharide biosynthesis protein [Ciceribacter naphthalenivorans]GLT04800.1 capsular polysaccharide biosynthesis protein [Sphingomonas psychrolutea]
MYWWPRRATWFTGRDVDWPQFFERYCSDKGITDILMLGDGRPKHAAAIDTARKLGIRVHVFEHGYLRPDWLTIEPDGMSGRSRFPRNAETVRAIAANAPPADLNGHFRSSFLAYALLDLAFHVPNVLFGWLLHPNYRTHGPVHPAVEYAGWIGKGLTARRRRRQATTIESRYLPPPPATGPRFFLFPLQLPGDYQIRIHAPIGDLFRLVEAVIRSFARHAPADARLLFKTHPIDNGLSDWRRRIASMAQAQGVADRVDLLDGGDLDRLIARAEGVVTVNSTVGLTGLLARKPVISLGASIYDIPGLTHQGTLASFWTRPQVPEADMPDALARALIATVQVRGGFIGKQAIESGAREMIERILTPSPYLSPRTQGAATFRYEAELSAL